MVADIKFIQIDGIRVVLDPHLEGAEMHKNDDEVRVSSALFKLLENEPDREQVIKNLKVKILQPRQSQDRRESRRKRV